MIVVENLPLPFDRRVWQEAQALVDAGWQVAAICPATDQCPKTHETIDGVEIYRHRLPEAKSAKGFILEYSMALFHQLRLLFKVWRRHGFDVIQGCNPPDLIFLAALPFLVIGKRYVFDQHDICPELFEVKFNRRSRIISAALLLVERLSYRFATRVITANQAFKELGVERTGTDPGKVTPVYSIPDHGFLEGARPLRIVADTSADIVIGYLGVIASQDGVDHLVRAMSELEQKVNLPAHRVVVVGDGPALPEVKALATDLGVDHLIEFTGYLSGDDLMARLASFDIGVIPDPVNAANTHMSMNKMFEYSALGIPAVGYPLKESQRLLGPTMTVAGGAEPADLAIAIEHLCRNSDVRLQAGADARERYETGFSWDRERAKYLGVLHSIVDLPPTILDLRVEESRVLEVVPRAHDRAANARGVDSDD